MEVRFHLDENMPLAVADGLRRRNVDVSTTPETALLGASDEQQLSHASRAGRVLVTRDADLLRLNAAGHEHGGIVFWTQRRGIGRLISALDLLRAERPAETLVGQIIFV